MNEYLDYLEIQRCDLQAEELVNRNMQKYRYVGEEGKEYEVIQSVFHEINQLPGLTNRQIRWYAVIVHLVTSFYRWRLKDPFLDFSSAEFVDGFKASTDLARRIPIPLFVPRYIEGLESYTHEIARLGALAAANQEISRHYLDHKMDRLQVRLRELLKAVAAQAAADPREDVYILTIQETAENVIKLEKISSKHGESHFAASINLGIYRRLITERLGHIDNQRLAGIHNMDAFWNGFIP